jgi:hypothetical protein
MATSTRVGVFRAWGALVPARGIIPSLSSVHKLACGRGLAGRAAAGRGCVSVGRWLRL